MVQVLHQLLGGTMVYLSIEFDKEGSKKLEEISNTYVPVEETENEANETTDEESTDEESTDETTEEITDEETIDTEKTITMSSESQNDVAAYTKVKLV